MLNEIYLPKLFKLYRIITQVRPAHWVNRLPPFSPVFIDHAEAALLMAAVFRAPFGLYEPSVFIDFDILRSRSFSFGDIHILRSDVTSELPRLVIVAKTNRGSVLELCGVEEDGSPYLALRASRRVTTEPNNSSVSFSMLNMSELDLSEIFRVQSPISEAISAIISGSLRSAVLKQNVKTIRTKNSCGKCNSEGRQIGRDCSFRTVCSLDEHIEIGTMVAKFKCIACGDQWTAECSRSAWAGALERLRSVQGFHRSCICEVEYTGELKPEEVS
jgi:hypothetical protein